MSTTQFFNSTLAERDPEIFKAMGLELGRQQDRIVADAVAAPLLQQPQPATEHRVRANAYLRGGDAQKALDEVEASRGDGSAPRSRSREAIARSNSLQRM